MRKKASAYETIIVLVAACIVMYLIHPYRVLLWVAIGLSAVSIVFPIAAAKIHQAWFRIAGALSFIMGRIIFTIIYIFVLLPLSFLFRKKVSIDLKRKKGSYFKERNHLYNKNDLSNVW